MSELNEVPTTPEVPLPNAYARDVLDFLAEEGFRPKLDEDGDVFFKYEGYTNVIMTAQGDATALCLMVPYFWPLEDAAERTRALEAAMYAQMNIRVGRITVMEKDVTATVNAYLPDDQAFKAVLLRSLSGLRSLVNTFRDQMRAQLEN
ncbi:hypothetical protein EHF33_19855 (plasmid) [Deinococcus psychrotolerans]|uniref:YbjN domain-containing protein n=1 Tax=Deinococcus psychrotolerans TaxID=2489213 RepID=A0A3G8YIR7_9DEIO|nr:hypothetical protein [Deinococcus psychrotolerans]AZI45169.1 hypothetical protein EHF33_19855 [Deinococcus psychrotolerans]